MRFARCPARCICLPQRTNIPKRDRIGRRPSARFRPDSIRADFRHHPACVSQFRDLLHFVMNLSQILLGHYSAQAWVASLFVDRRVKQRQRILAGEQFQICRLRRQGRVANRALLAKTLGHF